jgi:membrane fusion protein (multidrug efflux system)
METLNKKRIMHTKEINYPTLNNMKNLVLLAGISALLISCGGNQAGDKTAELAKLKQQEVELSDKIKALEKEIGSNDTSVIGKIKDVAVTEVVQQSFKHFVDIQGKVDAEENVNINAQMPGVVSSILVNSGDRVRKGQLLAELDYSSYAAQREVLKPALELATTAYQKQERLWKQKIGSEMQFLGAKTEKEFREKQLNQINETIEMMRIKSPIDGTIDEVSLKLGQAAGPGNPGIRVVNFSKLKATANVAESYAAKISVGNEVELVFPDLDKNVSSKISFKGRVINPVTRTFVVETNLTSQENYHPNMLAILKIVDYTNAKANVIPINTIQNSDEGQYVMVAKNVNGKSIAKRQQINVGKQYGGMAEITSGLAVGDKIITTGYQDLNDGDSIKF